MAKRIFRTLRAGFFAAACAALMPVSASAETLADAMASAYEHNGLLDQNQALLRAADEDAAATYALLRPIINWYGNVTYTNSSAITASSAGLRAHSATNVAEMGLSLELLLYDNGATKLAVEASRETVLATRQALISVEQQVLFDAVQSFLHVVRDARIVELRQNNLRLVARELQAAQDRFEVGEVTRTDVALAEASLAGGRADLAVSQGQLMQSQEYFASVTGHQPGALVAPTSAPKMPKSGDEVKAVAVRAHPDMIRAKHEITVAELNVARTRASLGPTVKLKGAYGVQETFSETYESQVGSLGFNVTSPIYQGGRLSALLRKSMAQRDATRAALHVTRHNVRRSAGNAWAQLSAAGAQLAASGRQVEASRVAFEGVREEAKLGSRTTLDVLIAEQDLLDAESNRITARAAQYIAAYGVLASMGQLTAEQLNLRVELYDPEAYYNMVKDAPTLTSKRGKKLDQVLRAIGKE